MTKLKIKKLAHKNHTPSKQRHGLQKASGKVLLPSKTLGNELRKDRKQRNILYKQGGLEGRKTQFNITEMSNNFTGTDLNKLRKLPPIPKLDYFKNSKA